MNYYEHHLGDYVRDTAHLSLLEDGAYRRLMDACYIRERPLPLEIAECCKIARATSKQERAAVVYVISQFFTREEDGYHQGRVDAEIARYQAKSRSAKASADARWNQNGRNANGSNPHMPTHANGHANALPTQSDGNALQSPIPSNQSPVTKKEKNRMAAKTPPSDPEWLTEFKLLYPERGGDQNWRGAARAGNARISDGHMPGEFLEGARRYREFCRITGKIGTEFVKQAATFLGPAKPFSERWDPPATKADVRLNTNLTAAQEFMRRTEPKH